MANELYKTDERSINEKIESLTFDPNTCIAFVDSSNNTYYYNNRINGCIFGKNNDITIASIITPITIYIN